MNYRHAFHAGNHADVLKHVVLLALCDALTTKPAPCFVLDTHAGRGLYWLDDDAAQRTGEAETGIGKLLAAGATNPAVLRYLEAVQACRQRHGETAYPGSPWLLAHALREQDHIACCELNPEEAQILKQHFNDEPRMAVHQRDGYAAIRALLPPRIGDRRIARGLVVIDPPYELQKDEFKPITAALREALQRWPQACYMLWYPIKQRRSLMPFYRSAAALPARSALVCELLVRADDSPLQMNGSGLLLLGAPWKFDSLLKPLLKQLSGLLADGIPEVRAEWLREPE